MSHWKWYVYIIECIDGTFYTGCTWKVDLRFDQHLSGLGSKYTSIHGVKRLVYAEEFENLTDARNREIQVKNWSQKKKNMLISGKWKKEW